MTTFLESVALRSFVILIITTFAAALYRHRSAAVLHRIWTLGLIGCLIVPVVSLISPAWELAVLPAEVASVSLPEPQPLGSSHQTSDQRLFPEVSRPQVNLGSHKQQPSLKSPAILPLDTQPEPVKTTTTSIAPKNTALVASMPPVSTPPLRVIIHWAWLTVFGLLLFLGSTQWIRVKQMLRRCQPLKNQRWQAIKNDVCDLLGVARKVTLRSSPTATSPMVTGIFRSWLIVPEQAQNWTDDRVRMVLLHELAHVKRNDLLTHTIAGVTCAVNWFNPLAWFARRQMQTLREIACDDQVVTHCKQSADYADTLLDVARTCRHQGLAMTVAMARTPKVEGRIMAILDSARNRAGLKRSSALLLVAVFGLLVGVIGSLQLKAIAQSPAQTVVQSNQKSVDTESDSSTTSSPAETTKQKEEEADPEEIRSMRIRVLDEKGKPLAKASVGRSVWEIEHTGKFPHKEYQTNEQGEVDIKLPKQIRILRLWPSKPGYVGQFLNFAQGTHRDGELIPDSYEFRLQQGKRLSGFVVDTTGNPIVGAKVQVSVANNGEVEPAGLTPKLKVNTWLAYGEDAAVTNERGQWEILNAPATKGPDDYKFNLFITHADFSGDTRWGERQSEQRITTTQLRDGTAKIKLDRGLKIRGTVRGPEGELVTKGLVIWSSEPYYGSAVNEAQIDETGHYESLPLSPGEYPVTVVAPGYAPQQIKLELDAASNDLDFKLESGNRIEMQFVDEAGDPIPKVSVQVGEWRGTKAVYNHKHSNVPDSGIPRKANTKGQYIWDWAPDDAVAFSIYRKGFETREVTLVARGEPHRIVLDSKMKIYGSVTDQITGEPIDKFTVTPVKAYRPDFYSTAFQDSIAARAGKFEISPADGDGETGNRYMVRIEAKGYRTAFSTRSMEVGDPPLHVDFALEPAPALTAKVIGPNGKPTTKFTVAVGTATTSPSFDIDRQDSSFGVAFKVEGGSNEFQLPATFERRVIRVFNDDGFAEIARSPDEPLGTVQLQPWARVSGRLMQGDKAIPDTTVYFSPLNNRGLTEARFQDEFRTTTDDDGNFQFKRLPPMKGSVRASLGPWRESEMTSSQKVPVDLKSGEHKKLLLGQGGTRIVGKVIAKGRDNAKLSKQWSINYLIDRQPGMSLPIGEQPLELTPDQAVDSVTLHNDDFNEWLNTKQRYFVKLADDGTLQIDGVPAGEYDLVLQLYEEPSGCLVETIGEKIVPITVTDGTSKANVQDIGEVEVECRAGPRVGSDMRAFKFVNGEGQQRMVNDLDGQYVLFHVWASWCAPCLQTMPNLKATVESHSQSPLTVVGLNIDDDAVKAKQLSKTGGWNWAMNYVGADSAIARQLAVSTAPAYYLIGPNGKLIMSSNQWSEVRKILNETLPAAPAQP